MAERQTKERQSNPEEHRVGRSVEPKREAPDFRYKEAGLVTLQRAAANTALASPADILALQRSYGNQAVQRWLAQRQTAQDGQTSARPWNQRQGGGKGQATSRAPVVIQRALADQVGTIAGWPAGAGKPLCTTSVWWWAAKEASPGPLDPSGDLVGRIPHPYFDELKALSDKKAKFLTLLGAGPKKTKLLTSMPAEGTVLLWEGNMVKDGGHHAAVVKGGRIHGYNQAGILDKVATTVYSDGPATDLWEQARKAYTIPEARIVAKANKEILGEEE